MLLPVLQREGHDVRALSRHPENLAGLPAEALRGDAVTGEGLERALDGVEVAYYLIHSMEPSPGGVGFVERERLAAQVRCCGTGGGRTSHRLPRRPGAT